MKTIQQFVLIFLFTSILLGCTKEDTSNSSEIINVQEAESCLITNINSDSIRYNADSSINAYGYVLFKRFNDTIYTQFYGFPYGYVVYNKWNRPEQIRYNSDSNSKILYQYIGETDKISTAALYGYAKDTLNRNVLSYYFKLEFQYQGDKITSAKYEFTNLSKNISMIKGTFTYTYSTKYTDSRSLTIQKLLSPIIFDHNPITEITLFSKYPVSKITDSQNNFSTIFTYEFDANGKIMKQIMNSIATGPETTTYTYSCK